MPGDLHRRDNAIRSWTVKSGRILVKKYGQNNTIRQLLSAWIPLVVLYLWADIGSEYPCDFNRFFKCNRIITQFSRHKFNVHYVLSRAWIKYVIVTNIGFTIFVKSTLRKEKKRKSFTASLFNRTSKPMESNKLCIVDDESIQDLFTSSFRNHLFSISQKWESSFLLVNCIYISDAGCISDWRACLQYGRRTRSVCQNNRKFVGRHGLKDNEYSHDHGDYNNYSYSDKHLGHYAVHMRGCPVHNLGHVHN